MIFYRAVDQDGLVHWLTVAAEARAIDKDFEQHDIQNDKTSLLTMLNEFQQQLHAAEKSVSCQHDWGGPPSLGAECLICGAQCEEPINYDGTPVAEVSPPPKEESYTERSLRFEDEFSNMPIALQLHYAATAMENARDHIIKEPRQ